MSSQDATRSATLFSVATNLQNYRLLELPPDLLEYVERGRRDKPLYFKSGIPSIPNGPSSTRDGGLTSSTSASMTNPITSSNLHLVSDTKIWAVKQVSTSNSVFVTAPSIRPSSRHDGVSSDPQVGSNTVEDDMDVDNSLEVVLGNANAGGFTAVSQPKSILELHSIAVSPSEIQSHLLTNVPVFAYDSTDSERQIEAKLRQDAHGEGRDRCTVRWLFDNTPAPVSLIEEGLRDLCVFTSPSLKNERSAASSDDQRPGNHRKAQLFRPTPALLLEAWKNISAYEMSMPSVVSTSTPVIDTADLENFIRVSPDAASSTSSSVERALLAKVANAITSNISVESREALSLLFETEPNTSTGKPQILKQVSVSRERATMFLTQLILSTHFWDTSWQIDEVIAGINPIEPKRHPGGESISLETFMTHLGAQLPSSWSSLGSSKSLLGIATNKEDEALETLIHSIQAHPLFYPSAQAIGINAANFYIVTDGSAAGQKTVKLNTSGTGLSARPTAAVAVSASTSTSAGAAGPTDKKRKWHEKFGAQRNNAKR